MKPVYFDPFVPNAPVLYHLKESENRKFFSWFQEVDKEWLWTNGLKHKKSCHFWVLKYFKIILVQAIDVIVKCYYVQIWITLMSGL